TLRCTRPGSISLAISCPLRMGIVSRCSEVCSALILRSARSASSTRVTASRARVSKDGGGRPRLMLRDAYLRWAPQHEAGTMSRWAPCNLLRRLVRVALHVRVDEIERRGGLLEHAPALEPVVGTLHLLERDRRGIADHEAALAQVFHLQRGNLRIRLGV